MTNLKETRRQNDKNYALWRCKRCGEFHIRGSRLIQINERGDWFFLDAVQSPCPKCQNRQRMQVKDVRLYESKEIAKEARELYQRTVNEGGWL